MIVQGTNEISFINVNFKDFQNIIATAIEIHAQVKKKKEMNY